jgi:sulfide:quinone oxidoreductase
MQRNGLDPGGPLDARTRYENVYAVGDVAVIPIPGRWKADAPMVLPKAGVFAHAQAEAVARRIASEIRGSVPSAVFRGHGYCALEAGEGMAGMAFGDFFAEPHPQLKLLPVSRAGHTAKVLLEQWWLASPGSRRRTLQLALTLGARWLGIPAAA